MQLCILTCPRVGRGPLPREGFGFRSREFRCVGDRTKLLHRSSRSNVSDCGCNAKKRRIRPYVGGVCWIDVPTFRMKHEEVLLRDGSFRVDGGPSGSTHDQTSAYESTIWLCDAATSSMANFRAALVAVVDLPSIPFGCGCDRSRRGRTTVPGRPTASKAMFFQKAFHRSNPVGRTP